MKQIITNYTFDKTAKTITLPDFTTLSLNRLMLVTNVTSSIIIYNFADQTLTASVSGNVITLGYNTVSMANGDAIQIIYDVQATDPDYQNPTQIETENVTWKRNFNGATLNPNYWSLTGPGSGQTVGVSAGNLVIGAGTTINAATVVQSLQSFTLPFRAQFGLTLSQRIANQTFYLELVNAAGDTYVGFQFDGLVATTAKANNQNGGNGTLSTSITTITTAATAIFELDCRAESVEFTDVAGNVLTAKNTRRIQTDNILDPDVQYFVRIRAVNGATAPASNTNMTVGFVLIQDMTKLVAEISGGRGSGSPGRAIPVNVQTAPSTAITGSVGQSTGINTSPWLAAGYGGLLAIDIASAAITTTATSAAITPGGVANVGTTAHQFNVVVTVATGTTPTMDIQVQESSDNGTNWFPIYDFERITATGSYNSPLIRATAGNRYRYVRTITGTTPSFTMALNRSMVSLPGLLLRRFIDRSIVINTLNSVTPTYLVEGCDFLELIVAVGAVTTTAPQVQLEGSETGITTEFYSIGAPLTAVASTAVRLAYTNELPKFIRARISTAGSGATANYIALKGIARV